MRESTLEATKPAVKRQLKEQWEKACNGYLCELLRMWKLDGRHAYWLSGRVGRWLGYRGGLFYINMEGIVDCVENDITLEDYLEHQEFYCTYDLDRDFVLDIWRFREYLKKKNPTKKYRWNTDETITPSTSERSGTARASTQASSATDMPLWKNQ